MDKWAGWLQKNDKQVEGGEGVKEHEGVNRTSLLNALACQKGRGTRWSGRYHSGIYASQYQISGWNEGMSVARFIEMGTHIKNREIQKNERVKKVRESARKKM